MINSYLLFIFRFAFDVFFQNAIEGFEGIIGGIEFGKISLLTGVSCLALIVALEFLILRDHEFEK